MPVIRAYSPSRLPTRVSQVRTGVENSRICALSRPVSLQASSVASLSRSALSATRSAMSQARKGVSRSCRKLASFLCRGLQPLALGQEIAQCAGATAGGAGGFLIGMVVGGPGAGALGGTAGAGIGGCVGSLCGEVGEVGVSVIMKAHQQGKLGKARLAAGLGALKTRLQACV